MRSSAVATSTASRSSTPTTSKAAYVRPEAKPDPVKAAYERPIGGIVPPPQPKPSKPKKAPGALPLSHEEKTISLPRKLALAFPNELDADSALSPHLYSPANLITTAKGSKGPAEGVLHGFWPAPPPRNSGKEIYPAPLVLPGTIAPEDDKRPRVDVFVDNSNILYSFLNWVRARPEAKVGSFVGMSGGKTKVSKTVTLAGKKVKMDYDVLFAILERGRRVEKRILAGSSPLWQSLDASINWVRFSPSSAQFGGTDPFAFAGLRGLGPPTRSSRHRSPPPVPRHQVQARSSIVPSPASQRRHLPSTQRRDLPSSSRRRLPASADQRSSVVRERRSAGVPSSTERRVRPRRRVQEASRITRERPATERREGRQGQRQREPGRAERGGRNQGSEALQGAGASFSPSPAFAG